MRRFAANHPELEGAELVEAYNRSSCTAERIGMDRAMRALHPAVQPPVLHIAIESIALRCEPHPDDVFLVPLDGRRQAASPTAQARVGEPALSA